MKQGKEVTSALVSSKSSGASRYGLQRGPVSYWLVRAPSDIPSLLKSKGKERRRAFISPMPISVSACSRLPESLFAVTTSCS
jgi:hypothetical protein